MNTHRIAWVGFFTLLTSAGALGASIVWDPFPSGTQVGDGSGSWDTGSNNWTANGGTSEITWNNASSGGDTAYFIGSVGGTITLNAAINANGLVFGTIPPGTNVGTSGSGANYTLTGNGPGDTLTLVGASPTISLYSGSSASISPVITGGAGLTLTSNDQGGSLTLTGANTYTGGSTVNDSNLTLDFSASGAPTSNIIAATNSLTLNSGQISIIGGTSATSQTIAGLTLITGNNQIKVTAGSGALTVNLGAIGRSAGTVLLLKNTGATLTTTSGTSGQILTDANGTAYAAVNNGADWAAVSGGDIVSLTSISGYTAATSGATSLSGNADIQASLTLANSTYATTSMRFNQNAVVGLNLNGSTVSTGGILVTTAVGSNANNNPVTISGGTLTAASAGGDLVIASGNSGAVSTPGILTLSAVIADNSTASTLTIAGSSAAITLSGDNTYTGRTFLNGVISIGSNSNLGAEGAGATLNMANGTLQTTATFGLYNGSAGTNNRNVVLTGGGGTFDVAAGTTLTVAGTISGTGGLTKDATYVESNGNGQGAQLTTGTGTLVLTGANTYNGGTQINLGTIITGNTQALGAASSSFRTQVNLNGGTLKVGNGVVNTLSVDSVYLQSGVLDMTQNNAQLTITAANGFSAVGGIWKVGDLTSGQITLSGGSNGALSGLTLDLGSFTDKNLIGSYNLISGYSGGAPGVSFVNGAGGFAYAMDTAGDLVVSAVPEPATYGVLGAGALVAASMVRRRRPLLI